MNVLFTHSYFLHFDPKQLEMSKPYPPLGTIQAAACVREAENEVGLYDPFFAQTPQEIIPKLDAFQPDVMVIYDDGFNYLTKMCLTRMREAAFTMIELASERGIPVWLASSDSTDHYEDYLNKGAELVILGEAEQTLLEIITAKKESKGFDNLAGLATKLEVK